MNEKVGKFIKELREKREMSQTELASLMFVSRQAISQWENGVHLPDVDKLEPLAEILQVELAELLKGEYIKDQKEQKTVLVDTIKNKNKQKKKLIQVFSIIIGILIAFILTFLVYYFINSYKSLKIYSVSYENDDFEVYGVMVLSRTETYFNIGTSHIDVKNMELYLKENGEIKEIISKDDSVLKSRNNTQLDDRLNYNNIDQLKDQLYLKIVTVMEKEYDIPLSIYKLSENDHLIFWDKPEVENYLNENTLDVPEKIKKEFTLEGDKYIFLKKEDNKLITINYFYKTGILEVYEKTNLETVSWVYNLNKKNISYYKNEDGKITENWKTDDINDEKLKYFKEQYYHKYFEE